MVNVGLDVAEGGMDALRVNDPEPVGVPEDDITELTVRIPVGDKVTRGDRLSCADGVKPNEGVA